MRSIPVLAAILVLASPIVPAAGQSGVQSGAPSATPAAPGRLACQANLTRLRVSIPPWEEARPWAARLLDWGRRAPEGNRAGHAYCTSLLDEVVVRFGPAGSE